MLATRSATRFVDIKVLASGQSCVSKVKYRGRDCVWKCFDPHFAIGLRAKFGLGYICDKRIFSEDELRSLYIVEKEDHWKQGNVFQVHHFDAHCLNAFVDFVNTGQADDVLEAIKDLSHSGIRDFLYNEPNREWSPKKEVCLLYIAHRDYMNEIEAYAKLSDLQGFAIPRFVAHVITESWEYESSVDELFFFRSRGILLEYVDSITLDKYLPHFFPEPAKPHRGLNFVVRQLVKMCNLLPWHSLHLENLAPPNILWRRENPADKPRLLFIDLKSWKDPKRLFIGTDGIRWKEDEFQAHARENQEGQLLEAISEYCQLHGKQYCFSNLASHRFRYFDNVDWSPDNRDDHLKALANTRRSLLWEISMDMVWLADPKRVIEKPMPYLGDNGVPYTRPEADCRDLWFRLDYKIRKTGQIAKLLSGYVEEGQLPLS
ncbi:MAG: hypothetical protein Q9160_006164 [Pyrenula sp. 1 TL-2023]